MSEKILEAIDEASAWLEIDGVESVGQGREAGQPCIVVGVSVPVKTIRERLPTSFCGFPVVVRFTGVVSAQ
jgi:hypothetical protein